MSGAGLNVTGCLLRISAKLVDACAIAKGAVACAEAGSEREAVGIAMDLDDLLHEVQALHGAMRLVGRMNRDRETYASPG